LRADAFAAKLADRFNFRSANQTVQRLISEHSENFERQALHRAADDISEAQCVLDFAADQRRDGHLTAHLDQESLEILITEKILRYRNLRRQERITSAAIGNDCLVGGKSIVLR